MLHVLVPAHPDQKLVVGLGVDLKLVADWFESISLVRLVTHAFVVWNVGVHLPTLELLAGGSVVHFVICASVATSAT